MVSQRFFKFATVPQYIIKIINNYLFSDLDDTRFCQEIISVLNNFGTQVCNVLRYLVMGGQVGLNKVIQRLMVCLINLKFRFDILMEYLATLKDFDNLKFRMRTLFFSYNKKT